MAQTALRKTVAKRQRPGTSKAYSVRCAVAEALSAGAMVFGRVAQQGWLQKRSEHIRTWRARYFLLHECGELLGYRAWPAGEAIEGPRAPDNRYSVRGCRLRLSDRPPPRLSLPHAVPVERQ